MTAGVRPASGWRHYDRGQAFLRVRRAGRLAFFGSGAGASVATAAILENWSCSVCHQAAGFNASSASFGVEVGVAFFLRGARATGSACGGAAGSGMGVDAGLGCEGEAANGFGRGAGAGAWLNIDPIIAPLMPLSVAIVAR